MRKVTLATLAAMIAVFTPVAAEAKRYNNDGISMKHRSLTNRTTHRKYASKSGGASRSCLTGAARGLLSRIESQFGSVQIISTCRPGARIAGSGKVSKHASGNAIDFRVPGKKSAVISWLRANHHSGGTMTYSDMDHVHVDIGSRFVALGRPSHRRG